MKIFILEDDPKRVEWLKEKLNPEIELDITDQVEEAMPWLHEREYDAIFLDHDLGGEQMVSSDVWNTGSTVARMIHETPNKHLTVIVHSYNPSGAKIMIDSMRDKGVKCYYFYFGGEQFVHVIDQVNKAFEFEKRKEETKGEEDGS
jgi:DNA-binding NtrC family response regulator